MSTDLWAAAEIREVGKALLDFEQLPGRYPVAMREPRILFDQAGLVLLLAAGRQLEGGGAGALQEPGMRQAARFFVRTVMLRPGVDFYTLLGVNRLFDADELREHYRLMIRMTHPDFAASGEAWPADAAARINQAHDVLASAAGRQNYQETWEKVRIRKVPQGMTARGLPPRASTGTTRRRWPAFKTFAVSAAMALVALTALVLSWPTSEDGLLTVVARDPLVAPAVSVPFHPDLAQRPEPPVEIALAKTLPVVRTPPTIVQPPALAVRGVAVRELPVRDLPVAVLVPAPAVVAMAPATPDLRLPNEPTAAVISPESQLSGIAMDQVQPMLTNVLFSLQSGQGEQVLQWLEKSSRQSDAAARFVAAYNQRLAGSRVAGLGPVRFTSRHAGGQLVVDGMVQLWLQDERQQTTKQDFRLRAYFMPRDSGPVLARLEFD